MWLSCVLFTLALVGAKSEVFSDTRSLRKAARGLGVYIGSAINYWDLKSDNEYNQLGAQQYNLLTAQNGCKMGAIWKSYNDYDFTMCDYVISYAEANSMAVRGHNLIWVTEIRNYLPEFVWNEQDAAALETHMVDYIQKVVSHVGEKAFVWDVINQAVSDNASVLIKDSPWNKIDDFLCKAFKAAHAANPKALLFYNDYNIDSATGWSKTKSDKVYNLLKDMRARGCPVHGVGLQAHLTIDYSADMVEGVRQNIQRYGDLNMDVHITELDIECSAKKTCSDSDWTEEMKEAQATIYQNLLKICLEEKNCRSFETWGYTDKYSWLANGQDGLPYDKQFTPKLAYDKMYEALIAHREQIE